MAESAKAAKEEAVVDVDADETDPAKQKEDRDIPRKVRKVEAEEDEQRCTSKKEGQKESEVKKEERKTRGASGAQHEVKEQADGQENKEMKLDGPAEEEKAAENNERGNEEKMKSEMKPEDDKPKSKFYGQVASEQQYLVKFKNMSYRKVRWINESEFFDSYSFQCQ